MIGFIFYGESLSQIWVSCLAMPYVPCLPFGHRSIPVIVYLLPNEVRGPQVSAELRYGTANLE